MKKILALLLILACSFALFACKDDKKDPDAEAYAAAVAEFAQASIAAPKGVTVSITAETALGTLKSSYVTTYNEDGSAAIEYSVEKFNGLDSEEDKSVVTGTITVDVGGNYSDGGAFNGANPVASGLKVNFASDKIKCTIEGDTLRATVAAADTEAVLGVALGADAVLTAVRFNGVINTVAVDYTATSGAVKILCTYQY